MWRIEINALPPSYNAFHAGMHWARRKAIVDEWHGLFLAAFVDANLPKPLPTPISLNVTEFCKGNVRDCDNAVVAAKLCADSLKMHGYIPDDGPKYRNNDILSTEHGKENRTVVIICQNRGG